MKKILTALVVLVFAFPAFGELGVPVLTGHVNDHAGLLLPADRQKLEDKLAQHERETSDQVVILTVTSLEGESIEDFSMRVAEKWKIGQKGKDNGIIIVYAKNDHRARIEIGYGLTSKLTAGTAGQIIREDMAPKTKADLYYEGFDAACNKIFDAVKGAFTGNGTATGSATSAIGNHVFFWCIAFVILLVAGFASTLGRHDGWGALVGGIGGGLLTLSLIGGIGWILLAIVVGAIAGALSRVFIENAGSGSGSSGSFFDSSGGGGSSSYSGGGGDFGGDGASGDA